METIFSIHQAGLRLAEVPIHFKDRYHGESKIPRFEIFNGARKLFQLTFRRLTKSQRLKAVKPGEEGCCHCGSPYMSEVFAGSSKTPTDAFDASAYKCTSMDHREKPHIAMCLHCCLIQIPKNEQPDNLEELYSETQDETYLDNEKARIYTFTKAFSHVEKYLPAPGKLLEIGAYCGLFLHLIKEKGWKTDGVEPSSWAIEKAKEQYGVSIRQGTLAENHKHLDTDFDAVAAWDVLEHVEDPYALLCDMNAHLRDGGILAFSTLNFDNWFPRIFLRWWPWLMPMHLHYFTTSLLRRWLTNAGYEILNVRSYEHFITLGYFLEKIKNILPHWLTPLLDGAAYLLPRHFLIKVSFGDIKMWVVLKKSNATLPEPGLRYENPEPF